MGTMLPETQSNRRVPVDRDWLNKWLKSTEICSAAAFNRNGVMGLGPQAFLTFEQHSSLYTSSGKF